MKKLLLQLGVFFAIFGICLYSYLDKQNMLTKLKMQLPQKERDIALFREENRRMAYQIDQFENPTHLIELAHRPEFCHLKHPVLKEILTVPEAFASRNLSDY